MAPTTNELVSVRLATPADTTAIADLGKKVFSTTFGHTVTPQQLQTFLDDSYSVEATAKDIDNPSKDMVVAIAGDEKILGFALLTRGSSEPCVDDVPSKIELQRLYVDMAAQGRGIGKLLMNKVENMARKQGYRNMWLGVWEENYKAQEVYQKVGYTRVGDHDFDIGGDIQTDHIMLKKL